MLQQMGGWKYLNGNARRSARAVIQEQCFGRAFHMKGVFAVKADEGFFTFN